MITAESQPRTIALVFLVPNKCLTTQDLQVNCSTGIQCSKVLVLAHLGPWHYYTHKFEFLPFNTKLLDMSDMANQNILQQQKKATISDGRQDNQWIKFNACPTVLAWHVFVSLRLLEL